MTVAPSPVPPPRPAPPVSGLQSSPQPPRRPPPPSSATPPIHRAAQTATPPIQRAVPSSTHHPPPSFPPSQPVAGLFSSLKGGAGSLFKNIKVLAVSLTINSDLKTK